MPHPHDDLDDLIRRTYVRPVDEDVAARHLEAMDAAVRELVPTPSVRAPAPRRRRALLRPAFATGRALVALPAGLAVAGVDLPDAVSAPYEAGGVVRSGGRRWRPALRWSPCRPALRPPAWTFPTP